MNNLCPYMTIVRIKMFTKIHGLNINVMSGPFRIILELKVVHNSGH